MRGPRNFYWYVMAKTSGDGKPQIIRIVKKKGGHAAHHGGSWKVAYADFVTAMMAFFMVMWILGLDPKTKTSIASYFQNPVGFTQGGDPGSLKPTINMAVIHFARAQNGAAAQTLDWRKMDEVAKQISHDLLQLKLAKDRVQVTLTPEGMRIEIIDSNGENEFFPRGSQAMTPIAEEAVRLIGKDLSGLDNMLIVEGHTDAARYAAGGYSNWDLSFDRANLARKLLEQSGIAQDRFSEVRGLADKRLRVPDDPMNVANRRISILLPFEGVGNVPTKDMSNEARQADAGATPDGTKSAPPVKLVGRPIALPGGVIK